MTSSPSSPAALRSLFVPRSLRCYAEPLRSHPPRGGLRRPGTAVGNPQVLF